MQFGFLLSIATITGAFILLGNVTGGLLVGLQRETTAIKQRYSGVSQEDRNARFNDPAAELNLPSNESFRNSSCGRLDEDFDNDGLTRKEEEEIGTSSCNPDHDGDGVADGVDTNPTDPRDGGTRQPPTPKRGPAQFGNLVIHKLDKLVKEPGSLVWGGYAEININGTANFRIETELENTGNIEVVAVIKDILPPGLRFASGSQTGLGGLSTLSASWFGQEHLITLGPSESKDITISFSVVGKSLGTHVNKVEVFNKDNPFSKSNASATIIVTDRNGGGGSFNFSLLDKKVKERSETIYKDSITTNPNAILDFKILVNVTNNYTETRNMILIDDLPNELKYISGTGNGGELFTKGFITIPVDPGNQTYEYTFSATVIAESTITTNIAKLYEAKFAPNGAIDRTEIVIN